MQHTKEEIEQQKNIKIYIVKTFKEYFFIKTLKNVHFILFVTVINLWSLTSNPL